MTTLDLSDIATSNFLYASEIDDLLDEYEVDEDYPEDNPRKDLDEDELQLLADLEQLRDDLSYSWRYGVTLISEDYFEDYARDLAEDIHGAESHDWPFGCIDWKRAARELRQDYTAYEIDGVTFYTRD